MKVIAISNYYMFHQSALWDEIDKHDDIDLTFLATSQVMGEDRKKMKYEELKSGYLKESYLMSDEELEELFKDVDIVVSGSSEDKRVDVLRSKAPVVVALSEHPSRRHFFLLDQLAVMKFFLIDKKHYTKGEQYLLAMSSHSYLQFKHFGFKNHGYQFGYFPLLKVEEHERDPYSLIWFGRVMQLKRVDYALYALKLLKQKDERYHLDIIGEGEYLDNIKKKANKMGLGDSVKYHGFMDHDGIMNALSAHSIHMFTSNIEEGWGVALNEGLAAGCICFANEKAGSTKFLVNENNGLTFKNKRTLKKAVEKYLSMSESQISNMRKEAKNSINNLWDVKIAANRLYEFFVSIYNHMDFDEYQSGPLSKIKE